LIENCYASGWGRLRELLSETGGWISEPDIEPDDEAIDHALKA